MPGATAAMDDAGSSIRVYIVFVPDRVRRGALGWSAGRGGGAGAVGRGRGASGE